MRYCQIVLTLEDMTNLVCHTKYLDGVPEDMRIVNVSSSSEQQALGVCTLIVESAEFSVVGRHCSIPYITPTIVLMPGFFVTKGPTHLIVGSQAESS